MWLIDVGSGVVCFDFISFQTEVEFAAGHPFSVGSHKTSQIQDQDNARVGPKSLHPSW